MNKKRMIIVTSIILSIVVISFGMLKLYNTYALSSYVDSASGATYNIIVNEENIITVPKNSYKDVFYMVLNTNPGTVKYNVAYTKNANVTVKYYSTVGDSASGTIDENGRKYVKLRITNTASTAQTVTLSSVLGYANGGSLIYDTSNLTLVSESIIGNFANYITSLYTNATKSTVTNNSITYNYATSVSLMNDRLGGTTTDYDGGNIRYYGAFPNNYVYFNCSDYSNQSSSTCEVWRIIGVFDGKVKIIRNDVLESLAWDQDKNINSSLTTYDNNWSTSSLQVLLNEKYYYGDTTGLITYYSGSNGTTETDLPLATLGIKNNMTRNMISEETYYLREYDSSNVYSNEIYNSERTMGSVYGNNPTSWKGKIALAYPSDYGYAADFNYCTVDDYSYCLDYNWMVNVFYISQRSAWLLSPSSSSSYVSFIAYLYGAFQSGSASYNGLNVNPVLSLNATITVGADSSSSSNVGSSTNPYQIIIS